MDEKETYSKIIEMKQRKPYVDRASSCPNNTKSNNISKVSNPLKMLSVLKDSILLKYMLLCNVQREHGKFTIKDLLK